MVISGNGKVFLAVHTGRGSDLGCLVLNNTILQVLRGNRPMSSLLFVVVVDDVVDDSADNVALFGYS
jgi:hypothetical protein